MNLIKIEDLKKSELFTEEQLNDFQLFYPQGETAIQVFREKLLDNSFYYQLFSVYIFDEKEREAYNAALKIVNSTVVFNSEQIIDSDEIVGSSEIKNSSHVLNSKKVDGSVEIYSSSFISDSNHIYQSNYTNTSTFVYHSKNVDSSSNIVNSSLVVNSDDVINSKDVFNSQKIIDSHGVTDSFVCSHCTNITNCLFCWGINNAEFYIFNQPVSKERYEYLKENYIKIESTSLEFGEWPEDGSLLSDSAPVIQANWSKYFLDWEEDFYEWLRSIPNYDKRVMLCITGIDDFIYY